jgi:hypothetical protein
MVFGNDGRLESGSNFSRLKTKISNNNNNNNNTNSSNSNNSATNINNNNATNSNNSSSSSENLKTLLDILKSSSQTINKNDLINALKYSTRAEINNAISSLLNDQNESTSSSTNLPANSSNASLTSLVSNSTLNNNNNSTSNNLNTNNNNNNDTLVNSYDSNKSEDMGADNEQPADSVGMSKLNLQSSENFDEHIASNVEFDDSDTQSIQKQGNEFDAEYEGDDEVLAKNDLSLFNELSRENYDITELDDGADLTGIWAFFLNDFNKILLCTIKKLNELLIQ